jgi:hypothetical protein
MSACHPARCQRHHRQLAEQIVKWIEATGKNLTKMMAAHGDPGNPYTLWTAAQAVFEHGQGASS